MRAFRTSTAVGLALALLVAPSPAAQADPPARICVDRTITTGLTSPWGLAFLPDGSALVTERDTGTVRRVAATGGRAVNIGRVRGVVPQGEGGLLGIAVPPGPDPTFVLVYFTGATDNRVVRIAWDGTRLGRQSPIVTGIPKSGFHNGGRLLTVADGTYFVSTGDAGVSARAQRPGSLAGKILHITATGKPAPGNPRRSSPVFSLGHRNVQGLAVDSVGQLWATEFGQKDVDELNRIVAGGNYGWPVHEGSAGDARYVDPFAEWSPTSIASPSGLAIVDDVAYVASLRGQTLWRVPLTGPKAGRPTRVPLGDLGRLRTVAAAPDGSLWLVTSNTDGRGTPQDGDDRILRLRVG